MNKRWNQKKKKKESVEKQGRHRWLDGAGQECHFRVPGAMTHNKTASNTALFLTFSPHDLRALHVHLLALQVCKLLKTIRPALSAYTSTFGAVSAVDHPLLIAIPLGSGGD